MCQRLNTSESNNFYFGIFICIGPLSSKFDNTINNMHKLLQKIHRNVVRLEKV